jgi:hypothetical protein
VYGRNGTLVLSLLLALAVASALVGGGWSWDSPVI